MLLDEIKRRTKKVGQCQKNRQEDKDQRGDILHSSYRPQPFDIDT